MLPSLQTPEQAAAAIEKGWLRGRFEIDFPKRFSFMLKALRWLPSSLYFKLVH